MPYKALKGLKGLIRPKETKEAKALAKVFANALARALSKAL